MDILNFILVSKQVRNGALHKGNNDVARGFIGCHVVSIMIMLVQYAIFRSSAHVAGGLKVYNPKKSSLAVLCCLPYQKVQFKYKWLM